MAKQRRRLLLDLTHLDTPSRERGIGRYIRDLAVGLSALPAQALGGVEILGLTSLDWSGNYTLTDDLASYQGNPALPRPTSKDYYRWAYRQRFSLWQAAARARAAAVHICAPHATPWLFGLAGCRRIVTCHDLVPTRFPERYMNAGDGGVFIGKHIERRRFRTADLVVAISDATRADLRSLLGVPEQRIVRVYNGVDVERWSASPPLASAETLARLGIKRPFVLYVGAQDWRKNTEGMMAGVAEARAQGLDVELVWAGSLDANQSAAVDAEASRFGVSDAVRKLGYVSDDDLLILYRAARAHLIVSRCEGFGLTVVEAMAAGCPVITTSEGSLREVAGEAALTVNPEDHRAIGQAIVTVCRDEARTAELVRRGRERAPLFSRETQALAMARVYRDFLGE